MKDIEEVNEAFREALETSDMEEFWIAQAAWSREVFGEDHERGPAGPLKHLAKEVQETITCPWDLMEYVDCLFLIFDSTRRAGFSYKELLRGAFEKLEINKKRKWAKPTSDEPVEHVREDS